MGQGGGGRDSQTCGLLEALPELVRTRSEGKEDNGPGKRKM